MSARGPTPRAAAEGLTETQGSANTAMPNYFLYIIVGISALAVSAWVTGAI